MKEAKREKWARDIIKNDYLNWENQRILFGIGTGRGKTTFVLDIYCKYLEQIGKKVLYLCNRKKLHEQILDKINENNLGNIELMTYQKFANNIKNNQNISQYDVYVCDEAHYFLTDSGFNLYTDIPYDYILKQDNAVVLYMSATYQNIFEQIKKDLLDNKAVYSNIKEYILPTDYSYVDNICWYQCKVYGVIDSIMKFYPEDKVLYFCNGITKMEKLYNHYSPKKNSEKDSVYNQKTNLRYMDFICSEYSNSNFAQKYSNPDAIIEGEKGGYTFTNRVLISTKCLDNGVDFRDKKIKHIICDIFDLESAIQCLGRKRVIDNEDTVTFYINDYRNNNCIPFLENVRKELNPVQLYVNDHDEYIEKYGNDRDFKNNTIYYNYESDKWCINYLRYEKLKKDEKLIKAMCNKKNQGIASYKIKLLNYLGNSVQDKSINMVDVEEQRIRSALEIFIETHLDENLDKNMQKELIELCNLRDDCNRKQKSIGVINAYLNEIEFKIESHRIGNSKKNNQSTIWKIVGK